MGDSILEKVLPHRADLGNLPMESEPVDDLRAFGYLRGLRDRCPMLELRKKDGSTLAIGYSWIESIHFDPSDGITVAQAARRIIIRGRHLNQEVRPNVRLFQLLCRHRVLWIQEFDEPALMSVGEGETLIDSLSW